MKQNNNKQELIEKIIELKKRKNAIILSHLYQNVEIDLVADYAGDSLQLSRIAASSEAQTIVFAGVYFMAETAKILSPQKKVLLPRLESGCLMADMIDKQQLKEFKEKHPNIPVVCYINSNAEVKALSDVCCTSSNAINVVKSLNTKEVLFVPDTYLGNFVASKLDDIKVITYPGYCPTHLRILPDHIKDMKKTYPDAMVLAHPECHSSVLTLADYVGSTTQIMEFVQKSDKKTFIIATELGVVERLERDCPEKTFMLPTEKAVCPNMKWHYLEDIYNALEFDQHEINVDENIAQGARGAIEKMVKILSS